MTGRGENGRGHTDRSGSTYSTVAESQAPNPGRLGSVIYNQSIQNQVLDRGIDNIRKISEYVINYIEMSFSDKYEDNLYHYNIFIQALKLNLEMLKKNARLDTSNENN